MSLGGEEYQNFDNGVSRSELFYPGGNTIINNSLTFSESAIPVNFIQKRFPFLMIKKKLIFVNIVMIFHY